MRKHKRPLASAKAARRGKFAAMPGSPIIAAGILGVGLASAIFVANEQKARVPTIDARIEPAIAPKTEAITAPKPDVAAIPVPEIVTGSISRQEPATFAAPAPPAKPKIAKKKIPAKPAEKPFFSFFNSPDDKTSKKR